MKTIQVNNKNNYEFTDYSKPIIKNSNDFRTSYYHGHNYYIVPDSKVPNVSVNDVCGVLKRKEIAYDYITESSDQYHWKYPLEYKQKAGRAITNNRPQFIKRVHEKLMVSPPKPIKQYDTIVNQDYDRKFPVSEEKFPFDIHCDGPEKPNRIINANTQGHYKYLDPYMTTNMKDYVPYTVNQQYGIARKDNFTVWDWFELPKTDKGYGLKEYPVKQKRCILPVYDTLQFSIPIKDRIKPNSRKFVPHSGITSEMRSNYQIPIEMTFDPQLYNIQPLAIKPTGIKTGKTEYSMIGSGKRIHTIFNPTGQQHEKIHEYEN